MGRAASPQCRCWALCPSESREQLPEPQGTAPLSKAVTYSAVTPTGNQDISTAISIPGNRYSVTGLQGKAMPGQQLLPNPIALGAAEIYGTERSRVLQSVLGRPEEGKWKFTALPEAARRLQDTDIR